jgi:hypothetical protein
MQVGLMGFRSLLSGSGNVMLKKNSQSVHSWKAFVDICVPGHSGGGAVPRALSARVH